MNVSAIIVTRGDQVLKPIWESLPKEWERVCWDNRGLVKAWLPHGMSEQTGYVNAREEVSDLSVYGRYAAIEFASHDLIYVQDDDCVVSDPQAIVDAWLWGANFRDGVREPPERTTKFLDHPAGREVLVANMPPEFRHDGYTDSCLVGFGACFHRDAPARAFKNFVAGVGDVSLGKAAMLAEPGSCYNAWFNRTCDVVFTTLTPRVLVDVAKANREFAEDEGRMYRTPGHAEERARMLELARRCRDA